MLQFLVESRFARSRPVRQATPGDPSGTNKAGTWEDDGNMGITGIMREPAPLAILSVLAVISTANTAQAQSSADSAAIVATSLDYIEGWYTGDAERMERALHPDLVKRIVFTDQETGDSKLGEMSADELIAGADRGIGKNAPVKRTDVTILDIYENTASVRIDAGAWIDYLHIARWNKEWVIINVLWEVRPDQDS
jgi:hypothetical protein